MADRSAVVTYTKAVMICWAKPTRRGGKTYVAIRLENADGEVIERVIGERDTVTITHSLNLNIEEASEATARMFDRVLRRCGFKREE